MGWRGEISAFLGRREVVPPPLHLAIWRALTAATDRRIPDEETGRFLQWVVARCASSHAQHYQDLWVTYEWDSKRGGFFVEFGAADGIVQSNTFSLETQYGWRGILAEPNPVYHEALKANRPNAIVSPLCVWSVTGAHLEFAQTRIPLLSAVVAVAAPDLDRKKRMKSSRIGVETISLNDLLERYDAPRDIDFISIDTEGAEVEVLRAFDFGRWNARLFCVEHNFTEREAQIDRLMASHGYERRFPDLSLHDGWYRRAG